MVDNKSNLTRHIQKYHLFRFNIHATHSYNIVIFLEEILFSYLPFRKLLLGARFCSG